MKKNSFKPGETYIPVSGKVYDNEEINNAIEAAKDAWWTEGRFTKDFERAFKIFMGVRYVSLVNSGSSANLIALYSLTSSIFGKKALKKGDEVINNMPEQNKYLRGLIIWTGFSHTGIPFNRKPRKAGESKATFSGLIKVAQNGIFSFSYLPLRFVSILGLVLTIVSFIALIINLLLVIIEGRQTPGVATIILLMLFLFGMLFFILGIMSEYIARIYEESKRRPNYIVKKKVNIS